MMKKTLSLSLAILMLTMILAGCGASANPTQNISQSAAPQAETQAPAPEPAAPAQSEAPAPQESGFPSDRAIKIVVPYDAGGGLDISTRILATAAAQTLGQRIDVVCMSGANGQEGIQYVLDQPSDGYSVLASDYGPLVSPVLQGEVETYQLDDWLPVVEMNEVVPTFFVRADSPYETMEDLIQAAIENPNSINVAHGRHLSVPHLPLILLENLSGAAFNHVPTSGGAEALTFVLGGNVDVGASVPSTVASGVKSGDLRVLGVCSDERVPQFPDAPTLKELGYDVVMPSWYMYFVKKDTPPEIIAALEKGFMDALDTQEARDLAATSSIDITNLNSADSTALYHKMNGDIKAVLDIANAE